MARRIVEVLYGSGGRKINFLVDRTNGVRVYREYGCPLLSRVSRGLVEAFKTLDDDSRESVEGGEKRRKRSIEIERDKIKREI